MGPARSLRWLGWLSLLLMLLLASPGVRIEAAAGGPVASASGRASP